MKYMNLRRAWLVVGLMWVAGLGGAAHAQFGGGSPDPSGAVSLAAELSRTTAAPGDTVTVTVNLHISPLFHINAHPAGSEDLIPTVVKVAAPEGLTIGKPVYPAGKSMTFAYVPDPVSVYGGKVAVTVPITVTAAAANGQATLKVTGEWQACTDTECFLPDSRTIELPLTIEGGASASAGQTPPTPDAPRGPAQGILITMLLAALGGFILNLTPCVLPVIPIKIMTLTQHAGSRGRTFYLGVWMAFGVVMFWVAAGLPMALLSEGLDPSRIFGIWWVTLGIGVLIAVMGAGIMGLFLINLPQAVYKVNPKADTPGGSFLFGVMTAVLGLPCFGFVAGALLAAAATLAPWQIMGIFTALGVGMAFPYLLLAAFPTWLERIPRTGPASELVKQVMGLLLLAAAAYFIGSGLIALVSDYPYLARELHWWVIAILAGLAGLWLIIRTFAITPSPSKRGIFTILGLIIAGAAAGYAMDTTLTAQQKYALRQQAYAAAKAQGVGPLLITTTWMDYEPGLPDRALDAGHTVVMDFTAEWCLNCKALKAAVLNVDPVRSRLAEDDVVSITVDLTSLKAPGWELLRAYGRTGIPLLVVLKPGADPWLANNYTAGQVMQAVGPSKAPPAPPQSANAEDQP